MPEPLTLSLWLDELGKLAVAFPRTKGAPPLSQTAELYRDNLRGVSADALRFAVTSAVREDQYFPKIARLFQLTQRYNPAHPPRYEDIDPLLCRGCGQRSVWESRWRPKITDGPIRNGALIYDEKGRVALETFQRYQCACSSPSQWQADAADDPFMTLKNPLPVPKSIGRTPNPIGKRQPVPLSDLL